MTDHLPPHPDDMPIISDLDQFKILMEEKPEQAEQLLTQGKMAVATLFQIFMGMSRISASASEDARRRSVGDLHRKDTLTTVAMQYGIALERFEALVDDWNDLQTFIISSLNDLTLCQACGGVRHDIEARQRQQRQHPSDRNQQPPGWLFGQPEG